MNSPTQSRSWIVGMPVRVTTVALAVLIAFLPALVSRSAQAQTFTLLYTFTGGVDGGDPTGALIMDAQGNLYGTTQEGGNPGCQYGCGTVFKVDTAGNETVLHAFAASGGDGEDLASNLVRDAQGNFYGTTGGGGVHGYGTVFKMDPAGNETILYSFTGAGDGGYPGFGGLVLDDQGNLYGTTGWGGDLACDAGQGCGTVFKIDNTGTETVLYSFVGTGLDGARPSGALLRDAQGNLYGTTLSGGYDFGLGTVFKVDNTGKQTVLLDFNGTDGFGPQERSYKTRWGTFTALLGPAATA